MKALYITLLAIIAIAGCNEKSTTKPITDMTASTGSTSKGSGFLRNQLQNASPICHWRC